MKKTLRCIVAALLVLVALRLSFYTEDLAEYRQREAAQTYQPQEWVAAMMRDSLDALSARAIALPDLAQAMQGDMKSFAQQHARRLGIGSPYFFVLQVEIESLACSEDVLTAELQGLQLRIPRKYIFGNTARDASGCFHIDDFKNTMDFNAISAEMNAYIARTMKQFVPQENATLKVLAAIAIDAESVELGENLPQVLTLIPYRITY